MLSDFENLCKPGTWFILYFRGFNPPKEGPFPFIKHGSFGFQEVICSDESTAFSENCGGGFSPADLLPFIY